MSDTDAWVIDLREQQLRDLRAQLATATARAEAAEGNVVTYRTALDDLRAEHEQLRNESDALKHRAEAAEKRTLVVEHQRQRAEAAEARVVNWISAEDRLPETQLRVLAVMLYDGRKPRIIRAMHIPAKTVECLDWEFNDAVVYDSESERHYFGAGWYELMEEGEYDYVGPLSDSVTHWAEMPELPEYFRQ